MALRDRKITSEKLRLENKKMEMRLQQLKLTMIREKEERMSNGNGSTWNSAVPEGGMVNFKKTPVNLETNKKLKLRMLKEEPIEEGPIRVPRRLDREPLQVDESGEGDPGSRYPGRRVKCGQCEETRAAVNCKECAEFYCPKCFAVFHLKGALRKHRSTPISANSTRVSIPSPLFKPPDIGGLWVQNEAGSIKGQATPSSVPPTRAAATTDQHQQQPRTSSSHKENVQPHQAVSSLATGNFDENFSDQYFKDALDAWRNGVEPSMQVAPPSRLSGSGAVTTDHSTQSNNQSVEPIGTGSQGPLTEAIQFRPSLSYAEQLLLRKHRSHQLAPIEMKYILNRLAKNNEREMQENRQLWEAGKQLDVAMSQSEGTMSLTKETEHLPLESLTGLWTEADRLLNQLPVGSRDEISHPSVTPRVDPLTRAPVMQLTEEDIERKVKQYTDGIAARRTSPPTGHPLDEEHDKQRDQEEDKNSSTTEALLTSRIQSARSGSRRRNFNDRPHSSRRMCSRKKIGGNLTTEPSQLISVLAGLSPYLPEPEVESTKQSYQKPSRPSSAACSRPITKISYKFFQMTPKSWKPDQTVLDEGITGDYLIMDPGSVALSDGDALMDFELEQELEKLNFLRNSSRAICDNNSHSFQPPLSMDDNDSSGESDDIPNNDVDCCDEETEIQDFDKQLTSLQLELGQMSHSEMQKEENERESGDILVDSLDVESQQYHDHHISFNQWDDGDKFCTEDSLEFNNRLQSSQSTTRKSDNDDEDGDELCSSRFDDYNDVQSLR